MDNFFNHQSTATQSKPVFITSLKQIFENILYWLAALFTLTEEEKIDAGIYIGRLGKR